MKIRYFVYLTDYYLTDYHARKCFATGTDIQELFLDLFSQISSGMPFIVLRGELAFDYDYSLLATSCWI